MRSDKPVRVMVISPQPVVEAGVVTLLSAHPDRVEVLPAPVDGVDFDSVLDVETEPEVVLYDAIGMLDPDAKDLDHVINNTTSLVLIISHELRPDLAGRALQRGAQGYFSLSIDTEDLVAAVESAVTGWIVGDPGEDPTVGSGTTAARTLRTGNEVDLSARELSTLTYVAQGLNNQEIAELEFISINSVKTYIRTAYRKIGVQTRSQAVSWAIQNGIDPSPGRSNARTAQG